jgi:hypothetical protein
MREADLGLGLMKGSILSRFWASASFDFIRANLTPANDARLFGVREVFDK